MKKNKKSAYLIFLLCTFIIYYLECNLIIENNFLVRYTTGPSVNFTYIMCGIFIFFIPNLIYAIFGLSQTFDIIEDNKYNNCMTCIFKPTQCNIPENSPDLDDSTSNNSSSHISSSGRVHGGGGGSF